MNCTVKIVVVLSALLLPVSVFAAASPMQEGQWEITTTMEMGGKRPMKLPANVTTHCYTKEDLKNNEKLVSEDKNCTFTESKSTGNKWTWKSVCKGERPATMEGVITYNGSTAYEGTMKMNSSGTDMNTKIKARRIGDCK
jgi:hypothetical protein